MSRRPRISFSVNPDACAILANISTTRVPRPGVERSFRAARHRPLHPSVYDWPVPGCTGRDAGVGFCNWVGSSAAAMRRQVVGSGLADLAALGEPLTFWRQSVVLAVTESEAGDTAESVTVRFTRLAGLVGAPGGGPKDLVELSRDFDLVVIATGFLPEKREGADAVVSGSYWRPLAPGGAHNKPITVVGDGDGALNEVLRLVLGEEVETLTRLADAGDRAFRMRLRSVEAKHRTRLGLSTLEDLKSPSLDGLDAELRSAAATGRPKVRLRTGTKPMRGNGFLLNRFLVSRMIANGLIEHDPRRATPAEIAASGVHAFWRVGPPRRDRTQLADPAVRQRDVADLVSKHADHGEVAGVVEDLMGMTRHAWWREGHPPALGRLKEPAEHQRNLAGVLHTAALAAETSSATAATTGAAVTSWPTEGWPSGLASRIAGAADALLAVLTTDGWAGTVQEQWLGLDAVALMADLTPRDVAFHVHDASTSMSWQLASHHDGRVGITRRGTPDLAVISDADRAIARQIAESPATPDAVTRERHPEAWNAEWPAAIPMFLKGLPRADRCCRLFVAVSVMVAASLAGSDSSSAAAERASGKLAPYWIVKRGRRTGRSDRSWAMRISPSSTSCPRSPWSLRFLGS